MRSSQQLDCIELHLEFFIAWFWLLSAALSWIRPVCDGSRDIRVAIVNLKVLSSYCCVRDSTEG